jgi:hypothetical protein
MTGHRRGVPGKVEYVQGDAVNAQGQGRLDLVAGKAEGFGSPGKREIFKFRIHDGFRGEAGTGKDRNGVKIPQILLGSAFAIRREMRAVHKRAAFAEADRKSVV